MTSQSKNNRLLPLTVIEAAAGGDVEAINAVLKHYDRVHSPYCRCVSFTTSTEIPIFAWMKNFGAGWKRNSLPNCSHSA